MNSDAAKKAADEEESKKVFFFGRLSKNLASQTKIKLLSQLGVGKGACATETRVNKIYRVKVFIVF